MNDLSPALSAAIAHLYEVYQPYLTLSHPEGCPCCVSDDDKGQLFSKALRDLAADDLDRFAWKVLTTWGEVNDLKHFLPRILELIALDDCGTFEIEAFFGKLRLGNWTQWPERERAALKRYFDAIWNACVLAEGGWVWLDELLCGLGQAVSDLTPFLKAWETCQTPNGYANLRAFLDWNTGALLKKGRLTNAFWAGAKEQMDQVIQWILSPETEDRLEVIFDENVNAPFAHELALAMDQIEFLRGSSSASK